MMKQWTHAERLATEKVVGLAFAEGMKSEVGDSFTQTVLAEQLEDIWRAIHDAIQAEIGPALAPADEEEAIRLREIADNVWMSLLKSNDPDEP